MKKISLLLLVLCCFSVQQSFAQFEGKIQFNSYSYSKSGQKKQDDDQPVVYITPERILLQGEDSYKVGGALKAKSILIRMKQKDFVFMTDHHKAMKISKEGITAFMNMFGDDAEGQSRQPEATISYKKTGDTQTVDGYTCDKFSIKDKHKPDEHYEVWMTQGLNINWGMLAEPWGSQKLKDFTNSDIPFKLIFEEGYFPLKWKKSKGDALISSGEAKVTKTKEARAKVKIPSGVKVMSLQNYLFQQMRKQH